jgi:osmotically-inducible protein OsmY
VSERESAERAQLVTRIRSALASGEGELGIQVDVQAEVITLRGVVQSDERRARIEALSRVFAAGLAVANEITVCPPDVPDHTPEMLP